MQSKYSGKMKKIEVDTEDKRFLINIINMSKNLNKESTLLNSVYTTFTAPDTGKKYRVKVVIASRLEIRVIADESDTGMDDVTTLVIDGLAIIPMER